MNCFNNVGPAKYTYASLTAIMTYKKTFHTVCALHSTLTAVSILHTQNHFNTADHACYKTLLTTGSSGGFFLTRKDFQIMFNH